MTELVTIRRIIAEAMPDEQFHDAMPTLAMVRLLASKYRELADAFTPADAEFDTLSRWEKREVEQSHEHDD